MDDQENKQLNEIHKEVQGSHTQLGAIDERTRNIQNHLENISDSVEKNEQDINEMQAKVKRNTTVINAVTVGLSGVVLWAADKLSKFKIF